MEPTKELIDELFLDKVRFSRRQTPEQKFYAGVRLFAQVKKRMRGGIRHDFPDADAQAVEKELRRRLAINRANEQRSWTK